jgi:phosphoglycolate phosphatase-like HAD superfamily hydrolase
VIPKPRLIFLDFDGVIMDSMGLKLDSYCHAFEGCGFGREAIRKLQLATAGMSRYKTIPLMYESLAGEPMPERLYQEALARFGAHDEASRGKMTLKKGTAEFLRATLAQGLPLAIITGTPQEVIDKTMEHFDLRKYFARVCGAPGSKLQHMERLLGEFGLEPGQVIFVGDAIKDQEAADALGIPFVGVNNGDDPFKPEEISAEIRSLDELLPLLGG